MMRSVGDKFEEKMVEAMKPNNYGWIKAMISSQDNTTYMSTGAFLFVAFFHGEMDTVWGSKGQIIPMAGFAFSMLLGLYVMCTRGAVFRKILGEKYIDDMQASLGVMKTMMRTHDTQSLVFMCSLIIYAFIVTVDSWKGVV